MLFLMEKFQEARAKAQKSIKIADHILSVTYPLVKDPKLILAIIENIFLAYTNAMSAILYYDRLFKKIPPFNEAFESKFNTFKARCVEKYNLDKTYLIDMQDIKNTISEHKKSPIEFARKDKFVICSENYKMRAIGLNELSTYINKAKVFIQEVDNITSKNDGLFR